MNDLVKFCETIRETFLGKFKLFALICALFGPNLPNFAQTCMPNFQVEQVEVSVDNINEDGISAQIAGIAKNALRSPKLFEKADFTSREKTYSIKIDFKERSFYKNVDSFHSLYARYQLYSEDGKCVHENVFCSEGKKSIVSALVQQKQIAKIARDLKKYFENESEKKNDV